MDVHNSRRLLDRITDDWVDGEYQLQQFQEEEKIISPTFPTLQLTAKSIFNAVGE